MRPGVKVKAAARKGKGLFAARRFAKGERILTVEGEVVETTRPEAFPQEVQEHWFPFDRQGEKHFYVLPAEPWMFLNHSCEPNAGIKRKREIVAMGDIEKGEEVLIDYAMNNIDGWRMECYCGSPHCRGLIGSVDRLDDEKKEEYKGFILRCLRD